MTSESHPIGAPAISAVRTFRQNMSNLSRWSSLIDARLPAPATSREGLSGRGSHSRGAPGFQWGIAALRELRNVAFLAGPGPPANPQIRHMSHSRKLKRRLTTRPSPPGWDFFRASKLREGGRRGQLLPGDRAWGRVGGFAGPNFGATGPEPPGAIGAKWLFPRSRAPVATGPRPTFGPAGWLWGKHVMVEQDGSRPSAWAICAALTSKPRKSVGRRWESCAKRRRIFAQNLPRSGRFAGLSRLPRMSRDKA